MAGKVETNFTINGDVVLKLKEFSCIDVYGTNIPVDCETIYITDKNGDVICEIYGKVLSVQL